MPGLKEINSRKGHWVTLAVYLIDGGMQKHMVHLSPEGADSLSMEKARQQWEGKFGAAMLLHKGITLSFRYTIDELGDTKANPVPIIKTHAPLWEKLLEFRNKKENLLTIFGITKISPCGQEA